MTWIRETSLPVCVMTCFLFLSPAFGKPADTVAFSISDREHRKVTVISGVNPGRVESTAVQTFAEELERETGSRPALATIPPEGMNPLVIVGTAAGNDTLSDLAKKHALPVDALGEEAFLLRTLEDDGRPVLLIAGGGERGVLYGVQEALDQVITSGPNGEVVVIPCDVRRQPALPIRGTYCLTCWGLAPHYDRAGWESAIDSMSRAGMNRIMFWMDGLFRSRKFPYTFLDNSYFTGVQLTDEDIHKLIKYAHDRGMKFYLGSGVFGWFTSQTFVAKFKEAADSSPNGTNLCPSHPLAQQLTHDYLAEMIEVFPEADGYMLEIRDEQGDCFCEVCQKPLDERGSKQFGQSELDLLEKLSRTVWAKYREKKFVWLMGFANHNNDPLYYERIRKMSRDPRMEWLEVRGSWTLPTPDGERKPLSRFSDNAYIWGGGYYAQTRESIQSLVQRILKAGLRGYLPAYEPGFGSASLYGKVVPYPVHLIPFVLTQHYYREFTWDPEIDRDTLLARTHRKFFSSDVPIELADDLFFLRRFHQAHYPELTCIAPGLIRTNRLGDGVEQIWNDTHMPDKEGQLTRLARRVRSLQELAKGGGDMNRVVQIEERIAQHRPNTSRRSARSFDLMQRCIDDIRTALAERQEDLVQAKDTLARIEARIAEYRKAKGTNSTDGS